MVFICPQHAIRISSYFRLVIVEVHFDDLKCNRLIYSRFYYDDTAIVYQLQDEECSSLAMATNDLQIPKHFY
jgi:hypothetical protein